MMPDPITNHIVFVTLYFDCSSIIVFRPSLDDKFGYLSKYSPEDPVCQNSEKNLIFFELSNLIFPHTT